MILNMNTYITGSTIKKMREKKGITQAQLADMISVSDKAVSRWETGKGFPDITLVEPLASALGISVIELFSGESVFNKNTSGNMMRSDFCICPVCGNIIHSLGKAVVSCCGITLTPENAGEPDDEHRLNVEYIENEFYITVSHEMTKQHYISFISYVTENIIETVKLYPEGNAEARFLIRGNGFIYFCCNHHGLMRQRIKRN